MGRYALQSDYDTGRVRDHYDRLSIFYRTLWGEHIHHGYWSANETPAQAKLQLIERLADAAGILPGSSVLDIGCGLGGSSRWLARQLGCRVLGITISPVQARMAEKAAAAQGLGDHLRFLVHDAHRLEQIEERFDAIWIIECSEHLRDRGQFFASCTRRLRPGGALALCSWLRGESTPVDHPLLVRVCQGMLCPMLGTMENYSHFLRDAGLSIVLYRDITPKVRQTWTQVERLLRLAPVQLMVRTSDRATRAFADACQAMGQCYDDGVMSYGLFVAHRPGQA